MFKVLETIRGIAVALTCLLAAASLPAAAQDVILNPGYISGTVAVTGQTINQVSISASWTDPVTGTNYSASTNLSSGGSYTLTVNVPQGSSPTYTVYASIYMNGYQVYLTPPSQNVAVAAFQTSTLDFIINPGLIEATINTTSGTLSSFNLYVSGSGGSGYASGSTSPLTFPVAPCTGSNCLQVYGYAYFPGGGYAFLDYQYVSVAAGETAALSWTVTPPPPAAQGTISGAIAVNGATANQHQISASGPSYGSASLSADGSYAIPDLNVGSYYMYVYSYFNNFATYLQHPDPSFSPDRNPTVSGGGTTIVNISSNAAFINGTVKLTGTKSLAQVSYANVTAFGAYQTPAAGGTAGTNPNLQSGAYSLVVTEGSWAPYFLSLNFNESSASGYLQESLYFYDYQLANNPFALAAGQTVTQDLTYGTGTVTVNYSVAGGGTLSSPYLTGSCYDYDQSSQLRTYSNVYSYGNQQNVTQGSVTFVAMAGVCSMEAWAQVGGSYTKFGTLSVTVVPGTSQEVDIGAPALTVSFPPPDYFTSNASITVTGTAVDDVAVASVTVNGQPATLTPAAPAANVSFSATVNLGFGANQIQTVATDASGKVASDTRTVYRDETAPTLSWTPADGASSLVAGITVAGSANDDAGIQSIKVNNVAVAFQPTGNGNEVSFSVPFTLVDGPNFIEVVATDISGKITAQTHRVTLGVADTTAPVITPTITGTLGANGWYKSNVSVTWAVVDAESPVTSTSGCTATTITVDTAGITLTCSATSTGGTASQSVTIKRDTRAPRIVGLPRPGSCELWPPNHQLVRVATVTAKDLLSGLAGTLNLSVTSNEPVSGPGAGSGNTAPDWVIGADGSIRLRAERSGHGKDRVYTIKASATDAAGNTVTRTATCVVDHDKRDKHDDDRDHGKDHDRDGKDRDDDHGRKDR